MDSWTSNDTRTQGILARRNRAGLITFCYGVWMKTKAQSNGFLPEYSDTELERLCDEVEADCRERKQAQELQEELLRNRPVIAEMESSSDRYLLERLSKLEAQIKELQRHVEEADIFTTSNK